MEEFQEVRDSARIAELNRAFDALAEFVVETRVMVETLAGGPMVGETERHQKWLTRKSRAMITLAKLFARHEANERAELWFQQAEEVKGQTEAEES